MGDLTPHITMSLLKQFRIFCLQMFAKQFKKYNRIKVVVPDTTRFIYSIGPWRHLLRAWA
jgi:hypothetical protein